MQIDVFLLNKQYHTLCIHFYPDYPVSSPLSMLVDQDPDRSGSHFRDPDICLTTHLVYINVTYLQIDTYDITKV